MKQFIGLAVTLLILYVIYYDLSHGTLPVATKGTPTQAVETIAHQAEKSSIEYFEKKVNSGDTVLSIVESHLNRSLPVSIQSVINDFQDLNNGLKPEEIQYGKTYKFPNYKNE